MHGANTWNETCTWYIYVLSWDQHGANNGGKELRVKENGKECTGFGKKGMLAWERNVQILFI